MSDKIKPALIGGVAVGFLSVIPFVGAVNVCCCAWAILGGLLASYMYVKGSPTPARPGDGAIIGAIAGVVGAAIYIVVGIPLGIITGNLTLGLMGSLMSKLSPEAGAMIEQQMAMAQNMSFGQLLISSIPGALIGAVCLVIFATVGGLLGVVLFEKRKGGAAGMPPPPPPNYGGGYGT